MVFFVCVSRIAVGAVAAYIRYLLRFLRVRKNQPKRAWKVLKNMEEAEDKYDLHTPITREHFEAEIGSGKYFFSGRSADGGVVLFFRLRDHHPVKGEIEPVIKSFMLIMSQWFDDPEVQRSGLSMLADCTASGWKNIDLQMEKMFSSVFQDAVPLRIGVMGMFNGPRWVEVLMKIMRPFMKKKLRAKVVMSKVTQDFIDAGLPADCLPVSLGGTVAEEQRFEWVADLREKTFGTREPLQPASDAPPTAEE